MDKINWLFLKRHPGLLFLFFILFVFFILVPGEYALKNKVILPGFYQFENQEALKNLKRVTDAVKREIQYLEGLTGDWAVWTDTFDFVKTRNEEYISSNLEVTLTDLVADENNQRNKDIVSSIQKQGHYITTRENQLFIYGIINGAQKTPLVLVEVKMERDIIEQGRKVAQFASLTVLFGAVLMLMFLFAGFLISVRYLKEQKKQIETELGHTQDQFSRAFHSRAVFMVISTLEDGRFINVNDTFLETMGYQKEEIIGKTSLELNIFPDYRQRKFSRDHIKEHGFIKDFDIMVQTKEKEIIHTSISSDIIYLEGMSCLLTVMTDITSRKKLEEDLKKAMFKASQMTADAEIKNYQLELEMEQRNRVEEALLISEKKHRSIIESIEDGYLEIDFEGNIVFFNKAICEITGYSTSELHGKKYTDFLDGQDQNEIAESMFLITAREGKTSEFSFKVIQKNGSNRHIGVLPTLIKGPDGQEIGFRTIVRDIDRRKKYEKKLLFLAYNDALTGLKNRKAFYENLDRCLKSAGRNKNKIAVLYLDIDRFKKVNDTLGHKIGDELLMEISLRLGNSLRQTDFVSRIGGDEFTVIINDPRRFDPEKAAERILEILSRPYHLSGHKIDYVSASIGISIYPDDGELAEELVKKADQAMYEAKKQKGKFVFFSCWNPTTNQI